MADTSIQDRTFRIAVIGDVHDQWNDQDERALHSLSVDLVLLVGDFGNEAVEIVRSISQLALPKAAIFGNHDAWYSATPWGRKKCPYDRATDDWVQTQLDLLGEAHVGYGKLDFPELGITVVGGRPFSWGGSEWKYKSFYRDRYGIHNFNESTARLKEKVDEATFDTLIFVGHCGPTGLGALPEAPCGRDWKPIGGDFGDPDLAEAIAYAKDIGKTVPLVTFGHMHHNLRHRKDIQRERLSVDANGTVYLNAACVPRIVQTKTDRQHNFSLVALSQNAVQDASLIWMNQDNAVTSRDPLLTTSLSERVLQPLK